MTPGSNRIRVLVADDEPLAREGLRLLMEPEKDLEIVAECRDGLETRNVLRETKVDLLLLDVQMPELNGFEVLRALKEPPPAVIFITAYDEFALEAFDVHALDYLLKPFSDERFRQALARARQILRGGPEDLSGRIEALLDDYRALARKRRPLQRLAVKDGSRVVLVQAEEIAWIEAADYYVRLHTDVGKLMMRESLKNLQQRLDSQRFLRIHRSAVVNLDRVRELKPTFKGEHVVILHDGTRLKLARSRRADLEDLLDSGL